MTDKIKVKSYYRDGEKVSAHTRSLPGGGVKISQVLAGNSENNPEDTLMVKEALQNMGYYEPPKDIGMHSHPDSQLFDAVKEFQKDNNLTVDGIIKPGGKTEKAMNYWPSSAVGTGIGVGINQTIKGVETHYNRLDLIHEDLRSGYGMDIIGKEKNLWIKEAPAIAHNLNGASGNVGYRGKVGSYREGQQVILDKKGYIVNSPENIGTPDYASPEDFSGTAKHIMKDVAPWVVLGNSPKDKTTYYERRNSLVKNIIINGRKNLLNTLDKNTLDKKEK